MTKVQSYAILILDNVRIVSLNVRKNKGTSECDNSTDISDVSTSQCEDSIMKSEKKKKKKKGKGQMWLKYSYM